MIIFHHLLLLFYIYTRINWCAKNNYTNVLILSIIPTDFF